VCKKNPSFLKKAQPSGFYQVNAECPGSFWPCLTLTQASLSYNYIQSLTSSKYNPGINFSIMGSKIETFAILASHV